MLAKNRAPLMNKEEEMGKDKKGWKTELSQSRKGRKE
jgi:hypothetical protein